MIYILFGVLGLIFLWNLKLFDEVRLLEKENNYLVSDNDRLRKELYKCLNVQKKS